jgi:hypothetical protein
MLVVDDAIAVSGVIGGFHDCFNEGFRDGRGSRHFSFFVIRGMLLFFFSRGFSLVPFPFFMPPLTLFLTPAELFFPFLPLFFLHFIFLH